MRSRHLVILALLLPIMLLSLVLWAKNTDAYGQAVRFVSRDARMAALTGTVKRVDFLFWHGFTYTGDHADFSFRTTSNKGSYIVDIDLGHTIGKWRIQEAEVFTQGDGNTLIILHKRMD